VIDLEALSHWFDGRTTGSPSVSYALFDRTGLLFHRGLGEFRRDGRAPTPTTVYRIASLSKSFCAATVLVLAERGLLSIDDGVAGYLPYVPGPVTIRMLLNNSSGLPEDNAWADYHLDMSHADVVALIGRGLRFVTRPGDAFNYSNLNFCLLARVVETVTGQEYTAVARTELLAPLGLSGTGFDHREYDAATLARPYQTFDDGKTWTERPFLGIGAFTAGGGMYSTLPDLARWSGWLSSAFLENAFPDTGFRDTGDEILSRASRRLMQRSHTPIPATRRRPRHPAVENFGYGLGLMVEQDADFGLICQHSGGLPGTSVHYRWHVETGIGIAALANATGFHLSESAAELLRSVLGTADRRPVLWPETVRAAQLVEDMIVQGLPWETLSGELSENVFDDVPVPVRAARLAALLAELGPLSARSPLRDRVTEVPSPAQVTWLIPGSGGALECGIEMTPFEPTQIQRVEIRAGEG
jgi:CubicO group peptidase (beta-lactamase class C family)